VLAFFADENAADVANVNEPLRNRKGKKEWEKSHMKRRF